MKRHCQWSIIPCSIMNIYIRSLSFIAIWFNYSPSNTNNGLRSAAHRGFNVSTIFVERYSFKKNYCFSIWRTIITIVSISTIFNGWRLRISIAQTFPKSNTAQWWSVRIFCSFSVAWGSFRRILFGQRISRIFNNLIILPWKYNVKKVSLGFKILSIINCFLFQQKNALPTRSSCVNIWTERTSVYLFPVGCWNNTPTI